MPYQLTGKLSASICTDCPTPLANVIVRLYRLPDLNISDVTHATAANPGDNFLALTEAHVKEKQELLVAEGKADENGKYQVSFIDGYDGGPLQLDVRFEQAPDGKDFEEKPESQQFSLDVFQPRWRQRPDLIQAVHEIELVSRYWCRILEIFGLWVICGTVLDENCKNRVPNVQVKACDRDLIQDDPLGEALTNGEGKFRIYYRRKDFTRTPLSPLFNSEAGSPDVYFTVQIPGSDIFLLEESRNRGLQPDRRDIPRCFCVRLCVEEPAQDPDTPDVDPLFTHVGSYDIRTDFDANGLTTADQCAFHNTIDLNGIKPNGGGLAWEYRFLFQRVGGSMPEALTGGIIGGSLISSGTVIGQVMTKTVDSSTSTTTYDWENFYVNNPSKPFNVMPDGDGWVRVPNLNSVVTSGPITTTTIFFGNSRLIRLNTHQLFEKNYDLTTPAPAYLAGDALPAGTKPVPPSPTYRFTFESRLVGSSTPAYTESLDKIVISNLAFTQERHPYWGNSSGTLENVCMLDLEEMRLGSGCDKITNTLTVSYTAYHPHIKEVSLWVEGNAPASTPAFSTSPTPDATGEALAKGITPFNVNLLSPCAYILWLRVSLRLTNGYQKPDPTHDRIAFCVG
jgi:hypothetical protein